MAYRSTLQRQQDIERAMQRKAERDRARLVHEASLDEMTRFNAAIAAGAQPIIHTFCGDYVVTSVDANWWYHSYPLGSRPDMFNTRSWCGCNDATWLDLLNQAGVKRNPLFAGSEG